MITFLSILGNLSFLFSAISFLMRSIFWLRVLAIASGILGVVYNGSIAIGYLGPANPELWKVTAWIGLFLLINIGQTVVLIVQNSEVRLDEADRFLLSRTFPTMRTRDFRRLLKRAQRRALAHGECLVQVGEHLDSLILVAEGELATLDESGNIGAIKRGQCIGELSFAIAEQYGGSPSTITANGEAAVLVWPYPVLHHETGNSPELMRAMLDGFFRGTIKKNNLLRQSDAIDDNIRETFLSPEERLVHGTALPSLSSGQFKRFMSAAEIEDIAQGQPVETAGKVGVLLNGACRVHRSDGQRIDIGSGNFLGEVGLLSRRDNAAAANLEAIRPVRMAWWSAAWVGNLEKSDPSTHTAFMRDIQRNMAYKLTRPLDADSGYVFPCAYAAYDQAHTCQIGHGMSCSSAS